MNTAILTGGHYEASDAPTPLIDRIKTLFACAAFYLIDSIYSVFDRAD